MTRAALAIAGVLLIIGTGHAQVGSVSPGKVARVHAGFEAQCERCHVAGGVPAKQCLACHTRLAERSARDIGLHATVATRPCHDCHAEHAGRDAPIVPALPAAFDHRVAVFPLEGRHAQLACARCHSRGRWVGIPTACVRCHADRTHRGKLGTDCAKCHRADAWRPATRAAADHRVSLAGGHAKLPCASCHSGGRHLVARQACSNCHAQPHGGTRAACDDCHRVTTWKEVAYQHRTAAAPIEGQHAEARCVACHKGFRFASTPASCAACHDRQRPHPPLGACDGCHDAQSWRTTSFDHAAPAVGFALDGAHATRACTDCHVSPIRFGGPRRGCTDCHADVHGPKLAGRACTTCHTKTSWRPSTITVERHASFGFALAGAHATAACAGCHRQGSYVATPTACASCHTDSRHRGRFGTACERCHDATRWTPSAPFDHALTGFALDRGHARVTCAGCHGADGKSLVGKAAPSACASCHASPHDRSFGARCAGCHTATKWSAVPRFDHDRTGFPLELRHATLRCGTCHDRRRPSIQRTCRSCHGDPHRGGNSFECDDCHRPDRWRVIRFDHDLTAYPLVGRHRIARCSGCHTNPSWTGVRTDCVACHAFDRPRDDRHMSELVCEDCHATTSWRAIRR